MDCFLAAGTRQQVLKAPLDEFTNVVASTSEVRLGGGETERKATKAVREGVCTILVSRLAVISLSSAESRPTSAPLALL